MTDKTFTTWYLGPVEATGEESIKNVLARIQEVEQSCRTRQIANVTLGSQQPLRPRFQFLGALDLMTELLSERKDEWIPCFSTLLRDDLRRLSSALSHEDPHWYCKYERGIFWLRLVDASEPDARTNPFPGRILEVRAADPVVSVHRRIEFVPAPREGSDDPGRANVFFCPKALTLDGKGIRALLDGLPDESLPGVFLPPIIVLPPDVQREAPHDSYFAEELQRLRLAFRELLPKAGAPKQSAALCAWRLAQEPVMRAMLMDGGSVRISGGQEGPTLLHVELWAPDSPSSVEDLVAKYRACFILGSRRSFGFSPPKGRFAESVAKAFRSDIDDCLSAAGAQAITLASVRNSWALSSTYEHDSGGSRDGMYCRLQELKGRFKSEVSKNSFDVHVLDDAKGNPPYHDTAARRFLDRVWRCPWEEERSPGAWRKAMSLLLHHDFLEAPKAAREWVKILGDPLHGAPPRLWIDERKSGAPTTVAYTDADEEELLTWRLVFPVGTVFEKVGDKLHLDDRHRGQLDREFRLG